jgi:quinol monooxygenase YgiN
MTPLRVIEVDQDYRVAIGNNRFYYAQNNGYTHIECVIAEVWRDRDTILAQTEMEYRKDY